MVCAGHPPSIALACQMPLIRYLRRCAAKFAPLEDPPEIVKRRRTRTWKRHAQLWRLGLRSYARSWLPERPPPPPAPPVDAADDNDNADADAADADAESSPAQQQPRTKQEADALQAEELKHMLKDNAQLFKVTLGEFFSGYQEGKEERRLEAEQEAAEQAQQEQQEQQQDPDNNKSR